jgi:hypothetical protein
MFGYRDRGSIFRNHEQTRCFVFNALRSLFVCLCSQPLRLSVWVCLRDPPCYRESLKISFPDELSSASVNERPFNSLLKCDTARGLMNGFSVCCRLHPYPICLGLTSGSWLNRQSRFFSIHFSPTRKMQVRDALCAAVSKPKISNKSVRVGPQQEASSTHLVRARSPAHVHLRLETKIPKPTASFSTRVCSKLGLHSRSLCRGEQQKLPYLAPILRGSIIFQHYFWPQSRRENAFIFRSLSVSIGNCTDCWQQESRAHAGVTWPPCMSIIYNRDRSLVQCSLNLKRGNEQREEWRNTRKNCTQCLKYAHPRERGTHAKVIITVYYKDGGRGALLCLSYFRARLVE